MLSLYEDKQPGHIPGTIINRIVVSDGHALSVLNEDLMFNVLCFVTKNISIKPSSGRGSSIYGKQLSYTFKNRHC